MGSDHPIKKSTAEQIFSSLPAEWDYVTIGELAAAGLADVQTGPFGTMLHASAYRAGGTPVIAVQHIGDNRVLHRDLPRIAEEDRARLARYTVQQGDILFGRKGAVERRAIVTDEEAGWLQGSDCIRARFASKSVCPLYVSYVLGTMAFRSWITRNAHGATMPSLNQEIISRIPLPMPPLSEQRAIAQVLGVFDDKIDLNRRMNETLESMARAVFKSWFVDFDPVRAQAERRQPVGMDAETAALFPSGMQRSSVGLIPRGWRLKRLPDVISINPFRPLLRGSSPPYLDMQNMPTQGHRPEEWIRRGFGSGMRFTNGDTLVARITPCLENGKTAYVDFLHEGEIGWGSTEYIVLRPCSPFPTEYGYYLARSEEFRAYAIQNMTGTSGRQRVPSTCFNQYLIAVPDAGILEKFGRLVVPFMRKVSANVEENRTLATLRDTLLPKLLSGAIRIRDAQKAVEAVV